MIVSVKDFKAVASSVGLFPSLGDFAGAGDYILQATGGIFTAYATRVVNTWSKCKGTGEDLGPVAIDARRIDSFAALCKPGQTVEMTVSKNVLTVSSGRYKITSPVKERKLPKQPNPVTDRTEIQVTADVAKRCNYLSEVAFADGSRAELSCVMLANTKADVRKYKALACNQTTVAAFVIDSKLKTNVPVPLSVARVLKEGDRLYAGSVDTILRTRNAVHLAPAAVKAQTGFPVKALAAYGEQSVIEMGVCDAGKLAAALEECATCLEPLSKLEIILDIVLGDKWIRFSGMNSGAKFQTRCRIIRKIRDAKFRVPLGEVKKVIPFLTGKVVLTQGKHGDLLMKLNDGWVLFPAWIEAKKDKKA